MHSTLTVASLDGTGNFSAHIAYPASGRGPGVVICQEIFGVNANMRAVAAQYAAEGYVAIVPDLFWREKPGIELGFGPADFEQAFGHLQKFDLDKGIEDIQACLNLLRTLPEVDKAVGQGLVGFCLGGRLAYFAACRTDAAVCVGYYGMGIEHALPEAAHITGRLVLHFAELDHYCTADARAAIAAAIGGKKGVEIYTYPGVDHAFARAGGAHFDKLASTMAHQRTIAALKREIGPEFDLSALWDKHCEYEFGTRNVDDTMATMVAEPYVNHIPTMTGGVGYRQLYRFYKHHFVHGNPPDMVLKPLSRTIGANQVVDEFILEFTHSTEIDWLLPGLAPTGRKVTVPMLGVIRFIGDKLCHEHIYWDQASVLVQIGALDPTGLPVAGAETAGKLVDETLPSNTLMARWSSSEAL
ncbi:MULTISPECIES: dienelactone hydrolase family protein [unclassified Acidovorax]|uniref:dienelactone hydrolase family protein n=1 Tax=unclassified Acidovorax TaxID=2684926 RepID=UPI002882E2F0|nr:MULTISPECIES: dienelactone hydrolase family protein [unclassified Acidovorax]